MDFNHFFGLMFYAFAFVYALTVVILGFSGLFDFSHQAKGLKIDFKQHE